jgi:cardiolipin synthase
LNASEKAKIWGLSVFYPEYRRRNKPKDSESELYQQLLSHPNITVEKDVFKADHSKYYVIDGKTLILGGINVEDKECGRDELGRVYQDYMVKIEGETHVLNFKTKRKNGVDLAKDYFFGMNVKTKETRFEMEEHYLSLIRNAKQEITIVMAYFSPLKKFVERLVEASNRGVRVRILMPKNSNFQNDTNYKTAKLLLKKSRGKIEIYFTEKMVHTKLFLTDDWYSFGSTNITAKAFKQLEELNLFVRNTPSEFTTALRESVEENFSISVRQDDYKKIKYNRLKTLIEGLLV